MYSLSELDKCKFKTRCKIKIHSVLQFKFFSGVDKRRCIDQGYLCFSTRDCCPLKEWRCPGEVVCDFNWDHEFLHKTCQCTAEEFDDL